MGTARGTALLALAAVARGAMAGGAVRVRVERLLAVTPPAARDAWLSYQWSGGGGLPVVAVRLSEDRRLVAPLLLEETLDAADGEAVRYTVSGTGLLRTELVPGSHSAVVSFAPAPDDPDATLMTWEVDFEARQRRRLWEAVTQRMISDAADNLASHLDVPWLLTCTTPLPAAPADALSAWLSFVWDDGGGLPLPPPIGLDRGDAAGDGRTRLIVPPGLRERVLSVDASRDEITYTVDNPGLLTYPVHTHEGRVRFRNDAGGAAMEWVVAVRPLRGCRPLVCAATESIVTTLARNLRSHLAAPGSRVPIAPPRGAGGAVGSVARASWLGGVLSAHLADRRPVVEQTRALLAPWTWGVGDDDAVAARWSRRA